MTAWADAPRPREQAALSEDGAAALEQSLFEIKRVIVGQDRVVERLLVCLLARGHCLLEGMAERHGSIGGTTYPVPAPFLVLATQNPIESEGVYPLPEAQRDRFLMKVLVEYPSDEEEVEIVRRMGVDPPTPERVFEPGELQALQEASDSVFVHDGVLDYAVRLVLASRAPAEHGLPDLVPLIAHGASPRATLGLVASGRALALMRGRSYVLPQDIFDVGPDVLRHRLLLSYEALADGVTADAILTAVLDAVPTPRIDLSRGVSA